MARSFSVATSAGDWRSGSASARYTGFAAVPCRLVCRGRTLHVHSACRVRSHSNPHPHPHRHPPTHTALLQNPCIMHTLCCVGAAITGVGATVCVTPHPHTQHLIPRLLCAAYMRMPVYRTETGRLAHGEVWRCTARYTQPLRNAYANTHAQPHAHAHNPCQPKLCGSCWSTAAEWPMFVCAHKIIK